METTESQPPKVSGNWRKLVHQILQADDTPRSIAMGFAVGVFVAWTPTVGVQMIVAGLFAWALRVNHAAAVATVWITNPYTIVPIFWCNYVVGHWLVGGPTVDLKWFAALLAPSTDGTWFEWLKQVYEQLLQVAWPLWSGSILVGVSLAVPAHYLALYAINKYRRLHSPHS